MRISKHITLTIFHYVRSSPLTLLTFTYGSTQLADILVRTVGPKCTHFFLPDMGFYFRRWLVYYFTSYDVQITYIILPLSPKLNPRLGLKPDTVSERSLRWTISSRIPPYYILCAVHYLTQPLSYRKIVLSVVVSSTEESHINDTRISGVSRPEQSVFQSGGVQVCLCTRCDVGTLWSWQFRCWKWKIYNFHTISVIFVEIYVFPPNCIENCSPFHLVLTSNEVGMQYSRNCCPPLICPVYSQSTLRFGIHILNNIIRPATS
jgi:hypothetical protein